MTTPSFGSFYTPRFSSSKSTAIIVDTGSRTSSDTDTSTLRLHEDGLTSREFVSSPYALDRLFYKATTGLHSVVITDVASSRRHEYQLQANRIDAIPVPASMALPGFKLIGPCLRLLDRSDPTRASDLSR
jgi:hypothetical protein